MASDTDNVVPISSVMNEVTIPPAADERGGGGGGGDGPAGGAPRSRLEGSPVTPLGVVGNVYHYLTPTGAHIKLRASEHSDLGIWHLFAGDVAWCIDNYPRKNGKGEVIPGTFNHKTVAGALFAAANVLGYFDEWERLRGPGAHRLADGRLVLHLGDKVVVDGEVWPPGLERDGMIFARGRALPPPSRELATGVDGRALLETLGAWLWAHPAGPTLYMGALLGAWLCGARRWRSHIWITGPQSSGKSRLDGLAQHILGAWALSVAGDTGEAGVRQELNGAALPVFFDEFEPGTIKSRVPKVVALSRIASGDSQGPIVRGTVEGNSQKYRVRSSFFYSSIQVSGMLPQDIGRITVLELYSQNQVMTEERRDAIASFGLELGAHFLARMIYHWPRIEAAVDTFAEALDLEAFAARDADQFSNLLAPAWMALYDAPPDIDQARRWIKELGLESFKPDAGEADDILCLQHLLAAPVFYEDHSGFSKRAPVGELAAAVAGSTRALSPVGRSMYASQAAAALNSVGIIVNLDDGPAVDGGALGEVAIANNHRALDDIFESSRWRDGWRRTLLRVSFARPSETSMRFTGGVVQRAVILPAEAFGIGPPAAPAPAIDHGDE